jgi:hypothetical protein
VNSVGITLSLIQRVPSTSSGGNDVVEGSPEDYTGAAFRQRLQPQDEPLIHPDEQPPVDSLSPRASNCTRTGVNHLGSRLILISLTLHIFGLATTITPALITHEHPHNERSVVNRGEARYGRD